VRLVVTGCDHVRMFIWVRNTIQYVGVLVTDTTKFVLSDILLSSAIRLEPFHSHLGHSFYIGLSVYQRHVTRQKILNWKQSIKFPARPKVSHEGINLMEQLLCEPEDRLGSQASSSVARPDSLVVQSRRSAFITPIGQTGSVDGAYLIKVVYLLPPGACLNGL
jgi:hypothetical protein